MNKIKEKIHGTTEEIDKVKAVLKNLCDVVQNDLKTEKMSFSVSQMKYVSYKPFDNYDLL